MKDAIIAYTEKFYGRKVERANVMASAGAKQAIMVALMALVDPGRRSRVSGALLGQLSGHGPAGRRRAGAGARRPTVPSSRPWRRWPPPSPDSTRVVLLNSPNNPSGKVFDGEFAARLVAVLSRSGTSSC